jgi:hypothetical protein
MSFHQISLFASLVLFALASPGCGGSKSSAPLSDAEHAKLGPVLQKVMADPSRATPAAAQAQRDGQTVYLVLIRTSQPSALRDSGLPIGSVSGRIVTARLTLAQIREAVQLDAVEVIRLSGEAEPTG